jgi:hypothetical protein
MSALKYWKERMQKEIDDKPVTTCGIESKFYTIRHIWEMIQAEEKKEAEHASN